MTRDAVGFGKTWDEGMLIDRPCMAHNSAGHFGEPRVRRLAVAATMEPSSGEGGQVGAESAGERMNGASESTDGNGVKTEIEAVI